MLSCVAVMKNIIDKFVVILASGGDVIDQAALWGGHHSCNRFGKRLWIYGSRALCLLKTIGLNTDLSMSHAFIIPEISPLTCLFFSSYR